MRTTLNIDDKVFKRLKAHSVAQSVTMSSYVEQAVINQMLEDLEDIEDAEARASEVSISYDQLVSSLKADGYVFN
jgi:predicted DNA-binding protein